MTAKILIASTLKPVWDPRAYEKLGRSLASREKYRVEIIGSGKQIPEDNNIKFHPLPYHRDLPGRLLNRWKILQYITRTKPDLLIITTHELIGIAVFYHLVYRKKIVYDIQENYNYNLRYQNVYPTLVRQLLASSIRIKERLTANSFSLFLLAEQCYQEEINFLRNRKDQSLVLENKCARLYPLKKTTNSGKIQLLLGGTISEIYGVFEAIKFYQLLPAQQVDLTIVGHCPGAEVRQDLEELTKSMSGVKLVISPEPIPHEEIAAYYTDNTIGLLPYQANKSVNNKVPTKLFEYLAHGIPYLISNGAGWKSLVEEYAGGMIVDFNQPLENKDLSIFFNLIKSNLDPDLQYIMWNSLENKFLQAIEAVLTN